MEVDAVIVTYNAERFISETLDSVFAQTRPAGTVTVVDNGSTDGTLALVARYPRVRVLRSPRNNVSLARNLGAQGTTGGYLAFLDHDDLWLPEKLERSVAGLEQGGEIAATGSTIIAADGTVLADRSGATELPDLFTTNPYTLSSVILTRRLFERVGGFDERLLYVEDYDLLLQAQLAGEPIRYLPQALVRYRVHEASCTATRLQALRDDIVRMREKYAADSRVTDAQRRSLEGELLKSLAIACRLKQRPGECLDALWRSGLICREPVVALRLAARAVRDLLGGAGA